MLETTWESRWLPDNNLRAESERGKLLNGLIAQPVRAHA